MPISPNPTPPWRHRVTAAAVGLATAGLLATTAMVPAQAVPLAAHASHKSPVSAARTVTAAAARPPHGGRTRTWAGFRIPGDGHADGGFIGGRTLGHGKRVARVYRINAQKGPTEAFYGPAHPVRFLGRRGPSRSSIARAAWALAKYGAFNGSGKRIQAAAVDAVVYDLLGGGPLRLNGRRGAARIRGTHDRYVRSYAATILRQSRAQAGPYVTRVHAAAAPSGSSSRITVHFNSTRSHHGIADVPILLSYGTQHHTVFTNSRGVATGFVTTMPGTARLRAVARDVPDSRLWVRRPHTPRSSAVADAGRHRTVVGHTQVTGVRVQKITVHNAHPAIRVGQDMAGTYTISNGSGSRQVTFSVYGPGGTSQVACDSTPVFTTTSTVTTDGTYKLPVYKPTHSGFYAWSVTAAGDASSAPASTCASAIADRAVSKLGQYRPDSTRKVSFGAPFGVGIVVSGFDRTESHVVTSRLYGPWPSAAAARCTDGRAASGHAVTRTVVTNGRYAMPRVAVAKALGAGYYVWRSTLAPGTLVTDSASSCGIPFQVVK